MMDPVFRSNPLDYCESPVFSLPPPLTPAYFTPSLILSLILLTWVMAFVIPNDSRNKFTVMRSHWVRGFFFSFSEITLHSSVQSTCSWDSDSGPGSELQWTSVKQINSFLGKTSLQPKWTPCPSEHVCFFFSNIQDLLSPDSLELISWPHVHAACYVSKLCLMTSLAYLLIYLASLVCVFANFLAVSSMIMHLSITEEVCVHACMSTHILVMMCVSPGLSRMSAPTHHYDSFEPLACGERIVDEKHNRAHVAECVYVCVCLWICTVCVLVGVQCALLCVSVHTQYVCAQWCGY